METMASEVKTKVRRGANYDNVNATWPDEPPVPTPQEALAGARKLVKLALTLGPEGSRARTFQGEFKLTSGRRYSWTRYGVFYVNPDRREWNVGRGWQTLVHSISHWAGRKLFPDASPHDHRVAFIERQLAEHVVRSGWLEGKLKREPQPKPSVDVKVERAKRIADRIVSWERKAKRADTALRKLRRQANYYARTR